MERVVFMKERKCLLIFFCFCFFASYAQDCAKKLETARFYKDKNDYQQAVEWYKRVLNDCGDYDGKVNAELKESQSKIPQNSPKKPSGGYVPKQQVTSLVSNMKLYFDSDGESLNNTPNIEVTFDVSWDVDVPKQFHDWLTVERYGNTLVVTCQPNPYSTERKGRFNIIGEINEEIQVYQEAKGTASGSNKRKRSPVQNNSSETTDDYQSITVKVSFEIGKAKPTFESLGKMLGLLEDNKNLGIMIELPWCSEQKSEVWISNKYPMPLMKKRIKNITDHFVNSGIAKERISWSMNESNTDCDSGYVKLKELNGESSK